MFVSVVSAILYPVVLALKSIRLSTDKSLDTLCCLTSLGNAE